MHPKTIRRFLLIIILVTAFLVPAASARASQDQTREFAPASEVTAFDLIIAMNSVRVSYGLPALVEDPIINAVAQSTAEIMAANQMSWHIGDVRGRLASAGYGGGSTVWGTENFAVGTDLDIGEIMVMWSDEAHMIPAVKPAYCHVGAGVARSANGMTYYVLQAAYTAGNSCGPYNPPSGNATPGSPGERPTFAVSQLIVPVKVATPDADGKVFHVVEAGQSFWAIAVAYKITIQDLETWNNISKNTKLQIGQKLFIPGKNTEGYSTPTPIGMIAVSSPDSDGKIMHEVQAYQTLSTIAQAYKVSVDRILSLNGLQPEWPLQIGQKLVIDPGVVTPSPTPRPLTPIERLTPAADGRYYHVVKSGESLAWIAQLYEIQLADLMAWNGLDGTAVLMPEQKLFLQVTPPATITPTPAPATLTPTPTRVPPSATPSRTAVQASPSPALVEQDPAGGGNNSLLWIALIGLSTGGLVLVGLMSRKK